MRRPIFAGQKRKNASSCANVYNGSIRSIYALLSKNGASTGSASSTPPLNQSIILHAGNSTGPDSSAKIVIYDQCW
jgi:hypothetical protein